MFVLASSLNDVVSPTRVLVVLLALLIPAAFVGFFVRSPSRGFKLGGLTSGGLTFLWLASGTGQAIVFAAFLTPIFAIVGGLVGGFFGWIAPPRRTKPARMHIEMSNPFEPVDVVDDQQQQDHGSENSQSVSEQKRSMDD